MVRKIVNVTPGLLPIPPNGWGAVEKIIWENHCNLLILGLDAEIKYLDDVDGSEDIVHIHVANLANMAHERGVPYYFMMHDHHSFLYGKESALYKENLKAIKNAKKAFVPAKYLVDYFEGVPEYFSHGVNTAFFKPENGARKDLKLLCVANNGYASSPGVDRKGFGLAIEMARHFNLPITIAGPKNNKNFFDKNLVPYDKLNIVYDLNEEQLLKVYQSHSIFIHMSELEAGHPNMTLLEAMACGLPVVGTLEANNSLDGMRVVSRNLQDGIKGLKEVIDSYNIYLDKALKTASSLDWKKRTLEMLKHYNMRAEGLQEFKNKLNRSISGTKRFNMVYKDSPVGDLPTFTFAKIDGTVNYKNKIKINYNFHNGAVLEILGEGERSFDVSFIDKDSGSTLYTSKITPNHWVKCSKSHYVNYKLIVKEGGSIIFEESFDLKNKKVYIDFDTRSLGDTLAWIPYVEEFGKKHSCEVYCATFFNNLFEKSYPDIKFIKHNDLVGDTVDQDRHDFYAKYKFGFFKENGDARKKHPSTITLQEVACDILGLEYKEIKPRLSFKNTGSKFKKPYVCIGTQTTQQAKYWNNPNGWKQVVDYIKGKGLDVVCIDKHSCFGNGKYWNNIPANAIDKTGDLPLEDRINDILNCEFFIGLGSGLSWLAWACNKPVVMIAGFSDPNSEFVTPYRVHNKNVCNSCWNDISEKFDFSAWDFCGRKKNFECSKEITFEMVREKIDMLIK